MSWIVNSRLHCERAGILAKLTCARESYVNVFGPIDSESLYAYGAIGSHSWEIYFADDLDVGWGIRI